MSEGQRRSIETSYSLDELRMQWYPPAAPVGGFFMVTLWPHQVNSVQRILRRRGILDGSEMGCVFAGTMVHIQRAASTDKMSIEDAHLKYFDPDTPRDIRYNPKILTKIRCMFNGELRSMPCKNIIYSGVKECIKITAEDGRNILLTPDHRMMTVERGWVQAGKLRIGEDTLVMDRGWRKGGKKPVDEKKPRTWTDISPTVRMGKDGYRYIKMLSYHPFHTNCMMLEHRAVVEAWMNNMSLDEWVWRVQHYGGEAGIFLDPQIHVHHINGIKTDNRASNLLPIDGHRHLALEHDAKANLHVFKPEYSKVKSIERVGKRRTYDCTVPDAENFVGNGFVVHNCGKGVTALYVVEKLGEPCIAVVPASLCSNWMREASRLFPELKVQRYDAKFRLKRDTNLIVMSYEMMQRCPELFKVARVYIADEAQFLCNHRAKRSKAFAGYVKKYKPDRLLLMSGTPLKNKIPDLWHLLKLLDYVNDCGFREAFPTWGRFASQFTHTHLVRRAGFLVTEYTGLRNADQLKEWLKPQYIACKLSDTDLPPLRHITISAGEASARIEKALRQEWRAFQDKAGKQMWGQDEAVVGEEHFSSAKARNALEKAEKTISFVRDLRSSVECPILIFSDHVAAAKLIAESLSNEGEVGLIHGGVPPKQRDGLVEAFQSGKLIALVATLGTMAVGWTLTAANVCVVNDKSWLVSVNRQAMKRIHRIGQTRPCIIYTMLREGMDEIIDATLAAKESVEQRVLGGLGDEVNP